MYHVSLPLHLTIEGCPEAGIAAIDFRIAHNFRAAPSNDVRVLITDEDVADDATDTIVHIIRLTPSDCERVCRQYVHYTDDSADLTVSSWLRRIETPSSCYIAGAERDNQWYYPQTGRDRCIAPHALPVSAGVLSLAMYSSVPQTSRADIWMVMDLLDEVIRRTDALLRGAPQHMERRQIEEEARRAERLAATQRAHAESLLSLYQAGELYRPVCPSAPSDPASAQFERVRL